MGGSSSYLKFTQTSNMGKGQNEGGFSEEQLQMYKDCFKLMDINKDGTLDKNDLRGAFDNVGVPCPSPSLTLSSERLEVPAPTSRWSRRRWPETETTPMTSLSRLSRPTTRMARLTPRCSRLRSTTSSENSRSTRTT